MRRNWTREELILAFNLYCKIPFGKYNQRTKEVIHLANLIQRTPSAVAFKLVNFASLDPYHQKRGVSGMKNAGKLDREIYQEFSNNWDDLIYESEILLNEKEGNDSLQKQAIKELENLKEGKDISRVVKTRVNQSFFRTVVLNIYSQKCAVSNIDLPELLIASHIIPWSANKKERLNPSNGICLSPLYDKLFDKGLMTITNNFEIAFSSRLEKLSDKSSFENFIKKFEGNTINTPEKFFPREDFLEFHRKEIFIS
ncbi:HNH endonuclease [Meridianimaribacter flavus]|uniref:Restriction endonuclease n=1 Tax=Meridianimaribacter flavus TaxID=571115 RepID=A0ABY2G842_9FLAO|nr:HNH endonuclease [Meridianimaribacter flavus]TDY13438.1 putative restriction endonuclease [Meridianimaribacter flavus]